MKAIVSRTLVFAFPVIGMMLATACSDRRVVPTPTPTTTPAPPPPPPPPVIDWEHAPVTPGDWVWSNAGGRSVATFANGLLQLRCEREQGAVVMTRRGNATAQVPMTVSTSAMTRTVTATSTTGGLAVSLTARDPLLDAMAFSRGHFAVEVPGVAPVYAPSWPEVSRVIEDCR